MCRDSRPVMVTFGSTAFRDAAAGCPAHEVCDEEPATGREALADEIVEADRRRYDIQPDGTVEIESGGLRFPSFRHMRGRRAQYEVEAGRLSR